MISSELGENLGVELSVKYEQILTAFLKIWSQQLLQEITLKLPETKDMNIYKKKSELGHVNTWIEDTTMDTMDRGLIPLEKTHWKQSCIYYLWWCEMPLLNTVSSIKNESSFLWSESLFF